MKIVFTRSAGILSFAIRKLTRSQVSHCFVVVDTMGGPCALEASAVGVRVVPMESLRYEVVSEFDPGLDIVSRDDWSKLRVSIGKPYDYIGLAGFLWVLLGRRIGVDLKNPSRSKDAMFCSESVVRILSSLGHERSLSLDPEGTSPQDLLEFCQETMA